MPLDEFGREIKAPAAETKRLTPAYSKKKGHARRSHPSERYQSEPMLCEFVWKEQQGASAGDDKRVETAENSNAADSASQETYNDYRRKYCLHYVRAFFNEHLDDSWFRTRYSPAAEQACRAQEDARAQAEAFRFAEQAQLAGDDFVNKARLSYGTKGAINPPPTSHLMTAEALSILQIPSHVTDTQLMQALTDVWPSDNGDLPKLVVYNTSPNFTTRHYLSRQAFVVAADGGNNQWRQTIVKQLQSKQVPRQRDHGLELSVECSDPYSRAEVDQDGRGGPPPDGRSVPPLSATVIVLLHPPQPKVVVMSAALSATSRIPQDREAAVTLARALDTTRHIQTKLDDLLEQLNLQEDADVLDVTIAYLRRVHLLSFYNGCSYDDTSLTTMGDVLAGKHGAATIHARLSNADEILKELAATKNVTGVKEGDDSAAETPALAVKDMLVQRLDDSIAEALEECSGWVRADSSLNEKAKEIRDLENKVEPKWLQDHSLIDEDNRARCSFHFCHKLFKDTNFLHKHLLKKHKEFLVAEQAKCHDQFMMKAWDAETNWPVPPVMVNCGANFGLRESLVEGVEPIAEDPEPDLWKMEEDHRQREQEMRQRREEARQQRQQAMQRDYVDVDDMPEEKVEICFENMDIPVKKSTSVTKKKKRKLL